MISWMNAHETRVLAIECTKEYLRNPPRNTSSEITSYDLFRRTAIMFDTSIPVAWGKEVMEIVGKSSLSTPEDTTISRWNLPATFAWWHFEQAIGVRTTASDDPIRALHLGWFGNRFLVEVWLDDSRHKRFPISPSQVFNWFEGETLGSMVNRVKTEYLEVYGPGGKFQDIGNKVNLETFMLATERLARFILSAIAWMAQKIVVSTEQSVTRGRRRAYERQYKRTPPAVTVIQLRRTEHKAAPVNSSSEESKVEWQNQWLVGGHWRNQPFGPGRLDRKLTWIAPYIKGPEGKPLKDPGAKVFEVNR